METLPPGRGPVFTAEAQWWNGESIHVLCPFCEEIHGHSFHRQDYNERIRRRALCKDIDDGRSKSLTGYRILFPGGKDLLSTSFEIDKENLRFVAGGASLSTREVTKATDFQAKRLRSEFSTRVANRESGKARKTRVIHQFCLETNIKCLEVSAVLGTAVCICEHMGSLSTSEAPQREIGSSKERSADDKGEMNQAPRNIGTSGETALHLAARDASPELVMQLIREGADPNAIMIDGRTPLMEATLWGWRENVEVLLGYGATKEAQCIDDDDHVWRAADFARPTRENLRLRHERMPDRQEDTYAREKDRRLILLLLEGQPKEQRQPVLHHADFRRDPSDSLSLVYRAHYNISRSWKAVGRLIRGGKLPEISAMSGWSHGQGQGVYLSGREWTDRVLGLCQDDSILFDLAEDERDQGVPGQYNASHVEKQLIAYFVYKHVFLTSEQAKSGISSLLAGLSLRDASPHGLASGFADDAEDWQGSELLEEEKRRQMSALLKAAPALSTFLRQAQIFVSKEPCSACCNFKERVNTALGLDIKIFYH